MFLTGSREILQETLYYGFLSFSFFCFKYLEFNPFGILAFWISVCEILIFGTMTFSFQKSSKDGQKTIKFLQKLFRAKDSQKLSKESKVTYCSTRFKDVCCGSK